MKLQSVTQREGAPLISKQYVACFRCGKTHNLSETKADLDGPAFKSYYCKDCADKVTNYD